MTPGGIETLNDCVCPNHGYIWGDCPHGCVKPANRVMPVKPKGAKDRKPRKKRTDTPKAPLPAYAQDAGRTVHIRINGMVSPEANARLDREGRALSGPEKLDRCLKKLVKLEKMADAAGIDIDL